MPKAPEIEVAVRWTKRAWEARLTKPLEAECVLRSGRLSRGMTAQVMTAVVQQVDVWARGRGYSLVVDPCAQASEELRSGVVSDFGSLLIVGGRTAEKVPPLIDPAEFLEAFLTLESDLFACRDAQLLLWTEHDEPFAVSLSDDIEPHAMAADVLAGVLVERLPITAVLLLVEMWLVPDDGSRLTAGSRVELGDPAVHSGLVANLVRRGCRPVAVAARLSIDDRGGQTLGPLVDTSAMYRSGVALQFLEAASKALAV